MKKILMGLLAGIFAILFTVHAWAYELVGVDIHGFISQGYLATTENNFTADSQEGSFEFNELGLNFSKQLTDDMRVGLQFFSKDLGKTGNNKVKIDWAYGDYRWKQWLGLRFGQIKSPHGLYNEYRDVDSLRNSIFLPQSIYPETVRDVTLSIQGAGLYGNIDMNILGWLTYQALYGTQTIDQNTRMSEALVGFASNTYDNDSMNVDVKYAASLAWDTPLQGLRLGVTFDHTEMSLDGHWRSQIGPLPTDSPFTVYIPENGPVSMTYDKLENWVYSAEYILGDLTLMAEYIQTLKDYETAASLYIVETDQYTNLDLGSGEVRPTGWYVGIAYRFIDWLEIGGYYSEFNSNYDPKGYIATLAIPDYYGRLDDICGTIRIDFNQFLTLKLEYHDFTGAYGLSAWDNKLHEYTNIADFEKEWEMYAAKMTVTF